MNSAIDIVKAIDFALRKGWPAAEILDENSPIRDGIRDLIAAQSNQSSVDAVTERASVDLAFAVFDLNDGWNAKEPEHLIAERIDLCRRLAKQIYLSAVHAPDRRTLGPPQPYGIGGKVKKND